MVKEGPMGELAWGIASYPQPRHNGILRDCIGSGERYEKNII
jgi:hypothetical protein